jgi:imidazolonepropionase-like amidohydrolase
VGTLRAGQAADVLVVEGDPLDDLACLGQVRLVMQDGETRAHRPPRS